MKETILVKNLHFRDKNCDIFIVLRKQNPKVWEMVYAAFQGSEFQILEFGALKSGVYHFSHLWDLLTEYYENITILVSKMKVFDQNNSLALINFAWWFFGMFVLLVGMLVLIPYLIPRFVTFTQKNRIPLRHDFFQHVLHTCTFYHSKSDNCGSAAVYFWAAMAPATHVAI